MADEQPHSFPQYQPPNPQGIPVSPHPKHASVLMKMIKSVGKIGLKSTGKKTGFRNKSGVKVSRKKNIVWY